MQETKISKQLHFLQVTAQKPPPRRPSLTSRGRCSPLCLPGTQPTTPWEAGSRSVCGSLCNFSLTYPRGRDCDSQPFPPQPSPSLTQGQRQTFPAGMWAPRNSQPLPSGFWNLDTGASFVEHRRGTPPGNTHADQSWHTANAHRPQPQPPLLGLCHMQA